MGRKGAGRVTGQDIAKAGGVEKFVKAALRAANEGDASAKETAAQQLASLAVQSNEHATTLHQAGAVVPLVHCLTVGSANAQGAAASALHSVARAKPEHQQTIVDGGGVAPLVKLLKTGSAKVQEEVAAALAALDAETRFQAGILKAGAIAPLVAMLKGGSAAAQASAAQALANAALSDPESGQRAIVKAGAVPLLLALLVSGKASLAAACALAKLAMRNAANQAAIMSAGGIAPLLALLNGGNNGAHVQAAAALAELARDNLQTQAAIAKAGGIGPLLALLSSTKSQSQAQAMNALAQLARHNRDNQDAIARQRGVRTLVSLLDAPNSDATVQAHSAFALMEVSRENPANQKLVVDYDGIDHLAGLMKASQHAEVKAEVAGALWALSEAASIKSLIAQTGAIPPLVQLLGIAPNERAREHSASALGSLALDNAPNQVQITQLLIDLLFASNDATQQARAAEALWTLVDQNPSSHDEIARAGDPSKLVELLKAGLPAAKDYALWALSLSVNEQISSVVTNAEGVEPLIAQLADGRSVINTQAAAALAKLARDSEETRAAITKLGGVKPLLALLNTAGEANHSTSELVLQNAAEALANLAVDPLARDEISTEGIQPVVRLLHSGGQVSKQFAAKLIARLAEGHETTQAAIAEAGAIKPLVTLLDGREGGDAQEEAAGALFALAEYEGNRAAITQNDGIGPLAELLACENTRAQKHAEGALVRLSIETNNRVLIIKNLVEMLAKVDDLTAQEQAAAALANLARESEDNRKSIVDSNGIEPLLDLLDSKSSKAKENAVIAVTQLCRRSKENQAAIAKVGGVPRLVDVLLSFSTVNKDTTQNTLCTLAAAAIKEMAKDNKTNQDAIAEAGGVQPLVLMLGSVTSQMQGNAAGALANLARGHPVNQTAVARTGAVTPLCMLLREGSAETKDYAASALWSLSTGNAANKDTIAKLGGIDPLLGLLVSGMTDRSQQNTSGALAALASKHTDNRALITKRLVGLLGSAAGKTIDRAERVLVTCSSFASDSIYNQVSLAKLGGVPPLITWLAHSHENAQAQAALGLLSIAADNTTTQTVIAKSSGIPPLIQLVRKSSPLAQDYAARTLWHLASQPEYQELIMTSGGIRPLVGMLSADSTPELPAAELAAYTLVRLMRGANGASPMPEVAVNIADKGGIPPLVHLMRTGSPGAQQWAAATLSDLALVAQNRDAIANADGLKPLIGLLTNATFGTAEVAARALANLALADVVTAQLKEDASGTEKKVKNPNREPRPSEEIMGGQPKPSPSKREPRPSVDEMGVSSPDPASKRMPGESSFKAGLRDRRSSSSKDPAAPAAAEVGEEEESTPNVYGSAQRRMAVHVFGGVLHLISMLDGSNLAGQTSGTLKSIGLQGDMVTIGMQEQGAAALAALAYGSADLQEAIINANGVPMLLAVMRGGSKLAQEHAARAIRNLAELVENHGFLAECGTIPELVQLTKTGSHKAQEVAAAGLSDLASGAIVERELKQSQKRKKTWSNALQSVLEGDGEATRERRLSLQDLQAEVQEQQRARRLSLTEDQPEEPSNSSASEAKPDDLEAPAPAAEPVEETTDRLMLISEAGGIVPLVTMLFSTNSMARENAAGALMHLALDPANQIAIAKANGIQPLVAILDDGTPTAHQHAAEALARLCVKNPDNQTQSAKHLVQLLANAASLVDVSGAQCRASRALSDLAESDASSCVIIVNGGAISPLVMLLTTGTSDVKREASRALANLSLRSETTQLAIASGLVTLIGSGSSIESQETISQLILILVADATNLVAIAHANAVPKLINQLRGQDVLPRGDYTSIRLQELAAAVLAHLCNASDEALAHECVDRIASNENGIPFLLVLLSSDSTIAQAQASSVISALARRSALNKSTIVSEGCITPLVVLLTKPTHTPSAKAHAPLIFALGREKGLTIPHAKAKAAGALLSLTTGQPETQKLVADAGAIKPLVALLGEPNDHARMRAAGAIASLCRDNTRNKNAFEKYSAIDKLVELLNASSPDGVRAEVATALAVLTEENPANKDKVAASGGIAPLVALLLPETTERVKEEAASALLALSTLHPKNQRAVAQARGIEPLVQTLSLNMRAQERAAGALAALALDNSENQDAIAKLVVSSLAAEDRKASAKAAKGIAALARSNPDNQVAIAAAGGVPLLVDRLLPDAVSDTAVKTTSAQKRSTRQWAFAAASLATPLSGGIASGALGVETAEVLREMANAVWAIADSNNDNQLAVAKAGGIPRLIGLLKQCLPSLDRDVAGALWSLAADSTNQVAIANDGGIPPLVTLLKHGKREAQETAAGAVHALAKTPANRDQIANEDAIPLLVQLFDGGTETTIVEAGGALQQLAIGNYEHQMTIATKTVNLLSVGAPIVQEHVAELIRNLAQDVENRSALAKAGAVPELVKQLECGSPKAMGMAASGLALIALKSAEYRATVQTELVKLLASTNEGVRQRASEALRDMAAGEQANRAQRHRRRSRENDSAGNGPEQTRGLVNLLKDGLRDGRVEAQEYALLSLASSGDAASREIIVVEKGIKPLIQSLLGGKLSATAQEHCATVLSGLAPIGENAYQIKDVGGIAPLVELLSTGNMEAKEQAAVTLAQIARSAGAANDVAEAGGVKALVEWLVDPALGPPGVAARALSDIALDNPDTQSHVAEEGAIAPLVGMVNAWSTIIGRATIGTGTAGDACHRGSSEYVSSKVVAGLKLAVVSAGTLATLAKENPLNQLAVAEEGGIAPLLALLQDSAQESWENPAHALWHLAADEDNKNIIPKAGGIAPLVKLLTAGNAITKQHAAAALESLARSHNENGIALFKAGAIEPLVNLLGSDLTDTQNFAVGALLHIGAHDEESRIATIRRLVGVLDVRNAAAQVKAAEALATFAARSAENRRVITSSNGIDPLVRLLGDGMRVQSKTPQERAAAVLSDLARLSENKLSIVAAGGVPPLVMMLSSESVLAQRHAAATLSHLSASIKNKEAIANAGGIAPLVSLVSYGSMEAIKHSAFALWNLAMVADYKIAMCAAGVIPPLVGVLKFDNDESREYAAGVLSAIARTQGGNKKAIVEAGGIEPLVELLQDSSLQAQRHAACALWGLAEGKEGVYDKDIVDAGAVQPLIAMLLLNHVETRGFAAACLLCCCADERASDSILENGGEGALLSLAGSPSKWLRQQAIEMLKLLGIPFIEPHASMSPRQVVSPRAPSSPGREDSTNTRPFIVGSRLIAQKMLPVRTDKGIDPTKENVVVAVLTKGEECFVQERAEVAPGIVRARVSLIGGCPAVGWLTMCKDGCDFLVSDTPLAPAVGAPLLSPSQRGRAEMEKALFGSTVNPNESLTVKMKYHFFSFQLDGGRHSNVSPGMLFDR